MAYLVQYHSLELNRGKFPGHGTGNEEKISAITHSISSRKKYLLLNSQGDTIFLILGARIKKYAKKKYFLWSKTVVKEIDRNEDENGFVNVSGQQVLMERPMYLNDYEGFEGFFKRASHFSIGLIDITQWDFTNKLITLSEKYKCKKPEKISYGEYIHSFKKYLTENYL